MPGVGGRALAMLALTLASNPAGIAAALVLLVLGSVTADAQLGAVLIAATVCWGILISDISVRDVQHDVDGLSAAAPGGRVRNYAAQWLASIMLALLFTAPVLLRWLAHAPSRAAALLCGVLALSAAAGLLGSVSRTARLFLALFLFAMYVATQANRVAVLDVVGFNGVASIATALGYMLVGVLLFCCGLAMASRREA